MVPRNYKITLDQLRMAAVRIELAASAAMMTVAACGGATSSFFTS